MSNMNYTNRNHPGAKMREVSLPRLLLLTLRRWRSMLLAGLILAVLLAGVKVLREYRNRSVSNVAHEEYLANMAVYNASVEAYTNAIERFQTKIDAKQQYFNESLLMQIDPHNESAAIASFVVRTPGLDRADDSDAEPGQTQNAAVINASNVVHAYVDFINSGISYDAIASEQGVSEQNIRELVLITSDQYHFSSVFKVQARSMDMDLSRKILDHIIEEIDKNRDAFRGTLGEYEISVVSRSEENQVDTVLLQQQTDLQNSIATLQKNLQTSQTSLKELIKPSEATGASTKTIIKHGIKYGVVGMAGGIFLMVLLFAIRILMNGRILTDDEINVTYGLRNLMTFPAGAGGREPSSAIDRLVERLVSDAPDMTIARPVMCCWPGWRTSPPPQAGPILFWPEVSGNRFCVPLRKCCRSAPGRAAALSPLPSPPSSTGTLLRSGACAMRMPASWSRRSGRRFTAMPRRKWSLYRRPASRSLEPCIFKCAGTIYAQEIRSA